MPGQIIRVYPASGANAMLPLTPSNNYTPTVLFCGGQYMDDYSWGNYSYPFANTWTLPASSDCQRITPEPTDGSSPAYVQDDKLPIGRSMGQFIALPDGTLLVINGAQNGTAGYAKNTLTVAQNAMPFGESLAMSIPLRYTLRHILQSITTRLIILPHDLCRKTSQRRCHMADNTLISLSLRLLILVLQMTRRIIRQYG